MKYSNLFDGKYVLGKLVLKGPHCSKKIASGKENINLLLIFLTEISGIGFYWYNKI